MPLMTSGLPAPTGSGGWVGRCLLLDPPAWLSHCDGITGCGFSIFVLSLATSPGLRDLRSLAGVLNPNPESPGS